VSVVEHVYVVREMPMDGEDRGEIHGVFTDLYMAMVAFNALSKSKGAGVSDYVYYSGQGDVCRVEPRSGSGLAWAVERVRLTSRPGMLVTEGVSVWEGKGES
jgi:hypothetical protein